MTYSITRMSQVILPLNLLPPNLSKSSLEKLCSPISWTSTPTNGAIITLYMTLLTQKLYAYLVAATVRVPNFKTFLYNYEISGSLIQDAYLLYQITNKRRQW